MDQNRQVDVGTLLSGVASPLMQNRQALNHADTGPGGGTHGERMAQPFQAAAQAAQTSGTSDAGEQFAVAAQAMRHQGLGKAANYYANGLEQAAPQFQGQSGVSLGSLLPLLQSFVGGVQQNNPAQPGQGTMIDALLPAVQAFSSAQQQGVNPQQAALQALTSAVAGARGTINQTGGSIDPGAASATNVLGGIVGSFLPGVAGALTQRGAAGAQNPADPLGALGSLGNLGGLGGLAGDLGGLLGGSAPGTQAQPNPPTAQDQDRFV